MIQKPKSFDVEGTIIWSWGYDHFEGLDQEPSVGDYNNAAKRTTFKGPHYLFNLKDKNVMLYNGQRKSPITTIPIDKFRTLEGNGKIE